jgi:putative phosphoribosyl transferase
MFRNREDAGDRLAARLAELGVAVDVVEALPRGGVPVAAPVARRFGVPLDALVVRKLGCPWQPELAIGALGEGGVRLLNTDLIDRLGVTESEIDEVVRQEEAVLAERLAAYRKGAPPHPVEGKRVVIVDDGLATGMTARAAIQIMQERGAAHVVLAVPVGSSRTVQSLSSVADDVICLQTPDDFAAVGQAYLDFSQTTDEQVERLLAAALQSGSVDPG